jgi:hypothetical protein
VALVVVSAPTARAQYGSDGTITFVTHPDKGKGKDATMTQYTSGKKIRMESADSTNQAEGAFIMDGNTGVTTILMIKDKKYMQITPQQVQAAANSIKPLADTLARTYKDSSSHAQPQPQDNPNIQVTKVGTETVAGTSCDVYHIKGTNSKGESQEGEVCSAQGVGLFMMSAGLGAAVGPFGGGMSRNPAMQSRYAAWQEVAGNGRGIIKATSIENGQKHVAMEATKIDHSTPADALFDVPPGYTKFEMPSFGKTGNAAGGNTGAVDAVKNGAANGAAQGVQEVTDSAAKESTKKAAKKLLHFP